MRLQRPRRQPTIEMPLPTLAIVTPALADANNGNWQTASRWAHLLGSAFRVRLVTRWTGGDEAVMVALHARRSADSVMAWRTVHPGRPLVLVLTGTDLYRDIASDASAQRSLELADVLVVLNTLGVHMLPAHLRSKVRVVLPSCSERTMVHKTGHHLRAVMVGHLRAEKDPLTFFKAARRLREQPGIYLDHIGAALDPGLGRQAEILQTECPRYRWLGALPHEATRRRIQRAHVLVHPSRMEGGAHVVIEAVRSGTPVLASRIDGNVGLLGAAYSGYFAPGDADDLASRLMHLHRSRDTLAELTAQAMECSRQYSAEHEARDVFDIIQSLGSAEAEAAPALSR